MRAKQPTTPAPAKTEEACQQIHKHLTQLGFQVIPIGNKKAPISAKGESKRWGRRDWQPDDFLRRNWGTGLGARASHICDIDIDIADLNWQGYKQLTDNIKILFADCQPLLLGRAGKLRHIIFRVEDRPADDAATKHTITLADSHSSTAGKDHLELRLGLATDDPDLDGLQTIIWGAHDGEPIQWHIPDGKIGSLHYTTLMARWQSLRDNYGNPNPKPNPKPQKAIPDYSHDHLAADIKADPNNFADIIAADSGTNIQVGKSYKCPLGIGHEDRNPSFSIQRSGVAICSDNCPSQQWSKASSGGFDIYTYIAQKRNLHIQDDFPEIIEIVCGYLNITPPKKRKNHTTATPKNNPKKDTQNEADETPNIRTTLGLNKRYINDWLSDIIDQLAGTTEQTDTANTGEGKAVKLNNIIYFWQISGDGGAWMPVSDTQADQRISAIAAATPLNVATPKTSADWRTGISPAAEELARIKKSHILAAPSEAILQDISLTSQPHNIITGAPAPGHASFADKPITIKNGEVITLPADRQHIYPRAMPYPAPASYPTAEETAQANTTELEKIVQHSLTEPDDITAYYEFAGSILYGNPAQRKMAIAEGQGATGKSTCGKLIRYAVGWNNSEGLTIDKFANLQNFVIVNLHNKAFLHIDDPLDPDQLESNANLWKQMTGRLKDLLGTDITKERNLHEALRDISLNFQAYISTNKAPKIGSITEEESIARRLLSLPMTHRIPPNTQKGDKYIPQIIADNPDELTIFASHALAAYARLTHREPGSEDYTISQRAQDNLTRYLQDDTADYLSFTRATADPNDYLTREEIRAIICLADGTDNLNSVPQRKVKPIYEKLRNTAGVEEIRHSNGYRYTGLTYKDTDTEQSCHKLLAHHIQGTTR